MRHESYLKWGSRLEKWVTMESFAIFGRKGHTSTNRWCLEKWVSLGKIADIQRNMSHLEE